MLKRRPEPHIRYVLHPELDSEYVHFEHGDQHPFVADATSMGRRNAWWLADAALLAYWDAPVALRRLRAAGMEAEALEADGLQGYLSWADTFVIVAFRGTEPNEWKDIFVDANFALVPHRGGTRIHAGFKASLEGVWPSLRPRLEDVARSRSVWFTGHSLGAALAVLAADLFEPARGVCTLGSPRVGDATFASAFDRRFADKSVRYVNDADIVTHVPPPLPGRYKHTAGLRRIRADGSITTSPSPIAHYFSDIFGDPLHMREVVNALLRGEMSTASDALLDHMPRAYTIDIWNDYIEHGN
jgi:triacylglycerol lipase